MDNFVTMMCDKGFHVFHQPREEIVRTLLTESPETVAKVYLLLPAEEVEELVFELYLITIKQQELFDAAIRQLKKTELAEIAEKLVRDVETERKKWAEEKQ